MSDFDPTTNRIPFGLLTPKEQTALTEWSHGWEYHKGWADVWVSASLPAWASQAVYRGKPAPVVTTTWSPIYCDGVVGFACKSHEQAVKGAGSHNSLIAILRLDITDGVASTTVKELKK